MTSPAAATARDAFRDRVEAKGHAVDNVRAAVVDLNAAFARGALVLTPGILQMLTDLHVALEQDPDQRLGGKSAEAARFIARALLRELDRQVQGHVTDGRRLGDIDPARLVAARISLHLSTVIASAVGRSFAPKEPGFRHAALSWHNGSRSLVGAPVPYEGGLLCGGVRFEPPSLALFQFRAGTAAAPEVYAALPLAGVAVEAAAAWLAAMIDQAGLRGEQLALRIPADAPTLPAPHSLDADVLAAAELGRWFAFADERLRSLAATVGAMLPVPCWPDHFDMAVVVRPEGPGFAPDAQVTLGFSPGDSTIPEPYFYVTAWPRSPSRVAEVPAPSGSRWQGEGWVGLALTATALLAAADPRTDADAFLERGFAIARDLVSAG